MKKSEKKRGEKGDLKKRGPGYKKIEKKVGSKKCSGKEKLVGGEGKKNVKKQRQSHVCLKNLLRAEEADDEDEDNENLDNQRCRTKKRKRRKDRKSSKARNLHGAHKRQMKKSQSRRWMP
jgi:hypothetical protein